MIWQTGLAYLKAFTGPLLDPCSLPTEQTGLWMMQSTWTALHPATPGTFLFMKWNVICNAEDRFSSLELFCRASHVRASMHRITSLELLRTLMLCLVQLSKWRECKATDAEKLLSERKVLNAILRLKLSTWKMFLSHEMNVICNAEDRFSCVRAFLQSKSMLELQCTESLV